MGVFLWVHLVVRSLLQGLRDGDMLFELATRLEELPSDLEQLYVHMLDRIPSAYRSQAAQIFRLLVTREQVLEKFLGERKQRLSALQFSYAIDDRQDICIGTTSTLQQTQRVAHVDARIRSRCFGLIEVVYRNQSGVAIPHPETPSFLDISDPQFHSIEFMHRTAFEFLTQEYVEEKLCGFIQDRGFDPLAQLFRSCVSLAKTSQPINLLQGNAEDVIIWSRLPEAFIYAKESENGKKPFPRSEVVQLDAAYLWQWQNADRFYKKMADTWVSSQRAGHWFRRIPERRRSKLILKFFRFSHIPRTCVAVF